MQRQRNRWWLLGLLVVALSACAGGSGSSGFDIGFTESAAIAEALSSGRCVGVAETQLTVCPADVTLPQGGPGSVETGLDRSNATSCAPSAGNQCAFLLPFMPEGLPPDAVYRVATRAVGADSPWRISVAVAANPGPGQPPDFDVPVSFERPTDLPSATTSVQLAVLVYLSDPGALPAQVDRLAESGADFAYVLAPIDVMAER